MTLDVELYRRTVYVPTGGSPAKKIRCISVLDIQPEGATTTLVFLHGYGGSALQWLYQLRLFGQTMRVVAPDMRGHGLSDDPDLPKYSMNGLVDDLEVALDVLEVQRPFFLIAGAYNVYPRDVEEVLYEHPKVLEAAVVRAGPGENGSNSPLIKAVVVLKRGEKATPDELLALCRERLDAYKVPAQIEFRGELPKNPVGKVLRRLLVEA